MQTARSDVSWSGVLTGLAEYLAWRVAEGGREVEIARLEALPTRGSAVPPPRAAPAPAPPPAALSAAVSIPKPAAAATADTPPKDALRAVADRIAACTKCALHVKRTHTVPGQGNPRPDLMFVGEGPGADEDAQGLAFVGAAGQLLTKMISAMGFTREEVFIANVVKCRPPGNRTPLPDEMDACMPYLREQIAVLRPKVIVALGAVAAKSLLATESGISRLRGTWVKFLGIDLMPTYHPSYLLRSPEFKPQAWADLQAVVRRLGRVVPEVKPRKG